MGERHDLPHVVNVRQTAMGPELVTAARIPDSRHATLNCDRNMALFVKQIDLFHASRSKFRNDACANVRAHKAVAIHPQQLQIELGLAVL